MALAFSRAAVGLSRPPPSADPILGERSPVLGQAMAAPPLYARRSSGERWEPHPPVLSRSPLGPKDLLLEALRRVSQAQGPRSSVFSRDVLCLLPRGPLR